MSNRDHQQSGGPLLSTLLPAQPLTDHQRTLMTEFLMLDALHQRHLSRLEAAPIPPGSGTYPAWKRHWDH